jgi:hypothetical protein
MIAAWVGFTFYDINTDDHSRLTDFLGHLCVCQSLLNRQPHWHQHGFDMIELLVLPLTET